MSRIVDWAAGRGRMVNGLSSCEALWWAAMPIRPAQRGRARHEILPFSYGRSFRASSAADSETCWSNAMETELSDLGRPEDHDRQQRAEN